jgi:hypothetical protein
MGRVLLLVPSRHGVMGASVHLPWEPQCIRLLYMAHRWAWPPLPVMAALGTHGSELFVTSWHTVHDPGHGSQMVVTSDSPRRGLV